MQEMIPLSFWSLSRKTLTVKLQRLKTVIIFLFFPMISLHASPLESNASDKSVCNLWNMMGYSLKNSKLTIVISRELCCNPVDPRYQETCIRNFWAQRFGKLVNMSKIQIFCFSVSQSLKTYEKA